MREELDANRNRSHEEEVDEGLLKALCVPFVAEVVEVKGRFVGTAIADTGSDDDG